MLGLADGEMLGAIDGELIGTRDGEARGGLDGEMLGDLVSRHDIAGIWVAFFSSRHDVVVGRRLDDLSWRRGVL